MRFSRRRLPRRTGGRAEEVEEGVVLDGLSDGARAAPRLVLLLLLDGLQCDVLALLPVYRAALETEG